MAKVLARVELTRKDGASKDAGIVGIEVPDGRYEAFDDTAAALHIRQNREQYGYEVNQADGLVYFGADSVLLSEFDGLRVTVVAKDRSPT